MAVLISESWADKQVVMVMKGEEIPEMRIAESHADGPQGEREGRSLVDTGVVIGGRSQEGVTVHQGESTDPERTAEQGVEAGQDNDLPQTALYICDSFHWARTFSPGTIHM